MAGLTRSAEDPALPILAFDGSAVPLEVFKPETATVVSPQADAERPLVSLASLTAAGIVFDANDAVAIGQALCRAFIGTQLRRRLNPDANATDPASIDVDSIFIDASGRVKVNIGDVYDESATIHALGKVLADMVPSDSRSFLKTKIISKALASPPQFETLDELSQAVDVLARPDGRDLIRAIYELWEHEVAKVADPDPIQAPAFIPAPIDAPEEAAPTVTAPQPEPSAEDVKYTAAQRAKYWRFALTGTVMAASMAMFGTSAWFLITRSQTMPSATIVPSAVSSAGAIRPTTSPAESAGTPTGGSNATSFPPTTVGAQPAAESVRAPAVGRAAASASSGPRTAATSSVPRAADTGRSPNSAAPMIATAIDISARPLGPVEDLTPSSVAVVGEKAPVPLPPPAPASPSAADRPGSLAVVQGSPKAAPLIYGWEDREVTPPTPVMPRLLAGLQPSSPNVRLDVLTIAVVVNEDGSVESVQGLVAPQNISEVLLLTEALSAVKSWHFKPATKDGAPVKYKQVVPLIGLTHTTP